MPKGKKKGKKQPSYPIGHPLHQQSAAGPSNLQEQGGANSEPASASLPQQPQRKEKTVVPHGHPENVPASTSSETAGASYIPKEGTVKNVPIPESASKAKSIPSIKAVEPSKQSIESSSEVESLVSEFEEKVEIERDFSNRMVITKGLPAKQPPGRLGRPIQLVCNLFPVQLPDGYVYHYDVKIVECRRDRTSELSMLTPAKDVQRYRCLTTKVNRKVIEKMLETNPDFRRTYAVYDGESNMYAPSALALKFPYVTEVTIEDDSRILKKVARGAGPSKEDDPKPFKDVFRVYIRPVEKKNAFGQKTKNCAINLAVIKALFQGTTQDLEAIQEAVMALETIFRHSPALRYTPVGRNFFHKDIGNICPISESGIEIWFGYHQSLRLGQWKTMINLNTSATTFFTKQPLIEYVGKSLKISRSNLLNMTALNREDLRTLRSDLKNLKIETSHIRNVVKMTNCIIDVSSKNALEITFEETDKDGRKRNISIAQYFKDRYDIKLEYPRLNCVQIKPKSKNRFLPMEVCFIPEGQHCRKELTDNDQREMIKFTADNPENRFSKISNIRKNHASYDNDEYLRSFGIKVELNPVQVLGRTIEAPNLIYANGKRLQPRDGSWNIRDLKFIEASPIPSWLLLNLADKMCNQRDLDNFANQLRRIGNAAGMRINQPVDIRSLDGKKYELLLKVLTEYSKKIQLAVVIIPFKNKDIYRNVKQIAEVDLALQTQCIDHKNAVKCNPSLLGNLCLKINAKLGGINHTLTDGEIPKIMGKPVIIIGADVSHAGVTDKSGISVAAVAGSLDMRLSRFAVTCKLQKNVNAKKKSVEDIINLKDMVVSLLKAFYLHTKGKKPEKIIFYRDGVSDGHFTEILEKELTAIRGACTQLGQDYQPAITFVVVQKRHHVRFRPCDPRQGARPEGNVPPGTVVDTEIVHPVHRDFYLCSHLGLKGTSRPAHYTVLADDSNFTADELQKLTYYVCSISFRCSKIISIPVPVAYADLAAYRTRLRLGTLSEEQKMQQMTSQTILQEAFQAVALPQSIEKSMYFV